MALMPAIMSLFGRQDSIQPSANQNPGGQVTNPPPTTNPTVPTSATPQSNGSTPAIPAAGTGEGSPLEKFTELWKTPEPDPKAPNGSLVPNFNLDHKGLMDAASKVSFTSHIPDESFTKALSGDVEALKSIINQAVQLGYANSTVTSGEIIKNSFGNAQGILETRVLPNALRNQQVTQALTEANPVFSNPAVAPMLDSAKAQFQLKYPTATPQEISTLATQYLSGFAQEIVKSQGMQVVSPNARDGRGFPAQNTDWENYFDTPAR